MAKKRKEKRKKERKKARDSSQFVGGL